MRCPFCGNNRDKVIDSRAADAGNAIRRRRECLSCNKRFTTYEHVEQSTRLTVVKRDGSRVPFDREKMLNGLMRACYKRPIPHEQIEALTHEIEQDLFKLGDREIESIEIGSMLAEQLRRLDQVAYVRFASVYRQFKDIDDLIHEVREMMATTDPKQLPGQGKLF